MLPQNQTCAFREMATAGATTDAFNPANAREFSSVLVNATRKIPKPITPRVLKKTFHCHTCAPSAMGFGAPRDCSKKLTRSAAAVEEKCAHGWVIGRL